MKTATKAKAPRQTGPTRNETGNTSVAGDNGNGAISGKDPGNGHAAAPPASAAIRDELNDLRAEREKGLRHFNRDREARLDAIDGQIVAAERRLEAAEVRELPAPTGPRVSRLAFVERDVPLAAIRLTGNHREQEDEAATVRLARSIANLGLQQRVGLRDAGDGTFELIWGSRRFAAVKLNGAPDGSAVEIAAKVYPRDTTAVEVEILRAIENFGRKELTAVERAIAVARTIEAVEAVLKQYAAEPEDGPAHRLSRDIDAAGGLHAYVGLELGFPAKWVKDNAYVSKLGGKTRQLLAAGRLDVGHARELAKLGDPEAADRIAEDAARTELGLGGQDVAYVRQRVTEVVCSLKVVTWRLEVAFGRDDKKGCGGWACAACPHNSRSDPDLFGGTVADEPAAGVCTNPRCFEHKQRLSEKLIDGFVARAKTEVKKHADTPVTERGLHHLIPIEIKPASAVRKAKKVLEPQAAKTGGSNGRDVGYEPLKLTPEETAQHELDAAERTWRDKALKALLAAAKAKPLRLAAICLLDKSETAGRWPWEANERRKQVSLARPLGELAARADGEAVLELAKKLAASRDVSVFGYHTPVEFLEIFVTAWEVKLAPALKLADFLPKPKAETSAKNAKNAKASGSGDRPRAGDDADGFEDPAGQASAPAEIRRFINNLPDGERPYAWRSWHFNTSGPGKGGDDPETAPPAGLTLVRRIEIADSLQMLAVDAGLPWRSERSPAGETEADADDQGDDDGDDAPPKSTSKRKKGGGR